MQNTITKPKRNRIPLGIKVGYINLKKQIIKIYYDDSNVMNYNILNRVTYNIL